MKLRFGIKLISLLFAVTFISSMVGYIVGARNSGEKSSPQKPSTAQSQPLTQYEDISSSKKPLLSNTQKNDITESYVLRENNGLLSLYSRYSDGREKLYQSYDISVSLLPKSDRELLKGGIEASTLSDALQLIEDYSS